MEFNLKNIEVRDPNRLYYELDKLVRFGDDHVTIKGEQDGNQGYYISGLLLADLNKSSVSSETISNLYSAIRNGNISHAVLPNDVRKGQIPLILDDHSRIYLKDSLGELTEHSNLSWRMFFVPIKDEVIDTELLSAEVLLDEDEGDEYDYVSLRYDEIEDYLYKILDKKMEDIDLSNLAPQSATDELAAANQDNDTISSLSFSDDEYDNEEDEEGNNVDKEREENENAKEATTKLDNELEPLDASLSDKEDKSLIQDDHKDNVEENNLTDDDLGNEQQKIMTNEYTMMPPELESMLDSFKLRRFEEFNQLKDEDTTHVILQKEIKNANQIIEEHEQNIIRKAKQLYFQYMDQSYAKINQVIDVENGDEIVKNKHNEAIERKKELDSTLVDNVENQKQQLEEKFWNEDYNIYKDQILAGLKMQFEKEEYYNLVSEPLERFKEQEKDRIEEQKYEVTHELSNWFDSVKDKAIMQDRNNAIIEVQKYLDSSMKNVQDEVEQLDNKMNAQNERFIKYEYGKKAEERLRNTVGSDLYTDEQAKQFKKQFELTEKQKDDLASELNELKTKYKTDIEAKDRENKDFKNEIENNHKQVIESKDKELNELNENVSKLEDENQKNKDKLESTKKNQRKKFIGTSIGGFLVSAFIFGGVSLGIYGHSKDVEGQLDSKNKVVEQHKEEASKNKTELEKIKKQKDEDHDKQQKIIDDQKKKLDDKAKKDKKDKKDKK